MLIIAFETGMQANWRGRPKKTNVGQSQKYPLTSSRQSSNVRNVMNCLQFKEIVI